MKHNEKWRMTGMKLILVILIVLAFVFREKLVEYLFWKFIELL